MPFSVSTGCEPSVSQHFTAVSVPPEMGDDAPYFAIAMALKANEMQIGSLLRPTIDNGCLRHLVKAAHDKAPEIRTQAQNGKRLIDPALLPEEPTNFLIRDSNGRDVPLPPHTLTQFVKQREALRQPVHITVFDNRSEKRFVYGPEQSSDATRIFLSYSPPDYWRPGSFFVDIPVERLAARRLDLFEKQKHFTLNESEALSGSSDMSPVTPGLGAESPIAAARQEHFAAARRAAFWQAVERKNHHLAAYLLDSDVRQYVNTPGPHGETPLYAATKSGYRQLVKVLLYGGANVDGAVSGVTPLHLAVRMGHDDVVSELLERGASTDAVTPEGETALHIAARAGNLKMVKALIAAGADVCAGAGGMTPEFIARQCGHTEVATVLSQSGQFSRPSVRPAYGFFPTNSSAVAALPQFINELPGAVVVCPSPATNTAPAVTAAGNHAGSSSPTAGSTELMAAVEAGDSNAVRDVLSRGGHQYVNTHGSYGSGSTPLYDAAQKGRIDLVRVLVSAGAELDLLVNNASPLHAAAQTGNADVVSELIRLGANKDIARPDNGATPLHVAAIFGNVPVVNALIGCGVNANSLKHDGETPLHIAASFSSGFGAMVALIASGADVNARKENGETPLHSAAKAGHVAAVRALIDAGAEVTATTLDGKTPVMLAEERKRSDVLLELRRK